MSLSEYVQDLTDCLISARGCATAVKEEAGSKPARDEARETEVVIDALINKVNHKDVLADKVSREGQL